MLLKHPTMYRIGPTTTVYPTENVDSTEVRACPDSIISAGNNFPVYLWLLSSLCSRFLKYIKLFPYCVCAFIPTERTIYGHNRLLGK